RSRGWARSMNVAIGSPSQIMRFTFRVFHPRSPMLRAALCLLSLPLCPTARGADPKVPDTEFVIRGATIHDGTGKPGYRGDLHIKGDRIVAVGRVGGAEGAKLIDGAGLIVSPGFIDLHTHCDSGLTGKVDRANKNYATQGCTTVVTGNCGSGPVDAGKWFA